MDDYIGIHITGRTINVIFVVHEQEKDAVINGTKKLNLKYEEVEITPDMLRGMSFKSL